MTTTETGRRVAHEQIERLGDELLDDTIIQTAVKAFEAKLIEQGRLLPAPTGVERRYALDAADVEAYIKRHRDAEITLTDAWYTLDSLLDDFRDHLYTGTPLDQDVEGPTAPGEQ